MKKNRDPINVLYKKKSWTQLVYYHNKSGIHTVVVPTIIRYPTSILPVITEFYL